MFFTFSKKTIPPVLSKNKDTEVKDLTVKTPIPIKIGNMFRLAQPTAKCSSCNSYR